ncbi:MAG: RsmD family RNA methyltransferase [Deltaproteobacteria bacterium]|nr:RsmD family RNA methyltransferase [Deltaproteobacteria bacterium]
MRIIAGTARGRRLFSPGSGTSDIRPTSDRAREALFSILADRAIEARVLDLFAGTGALGLEALSRGAASALFWYLLIRLIKANRRKGSSGNWAGWKSSAPAACWWLKLALPTGCPRRFRFLPWWTGARTARPASGFMCRGKLIRKPGARSQESGVRSRKITPLSDSWILTPDSINRRGTCRE